MRKYFVLSMIFFFTTESKSQTGNIGIGVTNPSDKLHINSAAGADALRVQVDGITKLRVWSNGGISIGSPVTPPVNGIYVAGSIQPSSGIITPSKLVVESTGDSIILNAGGSQVIVASNGNITIKANGPGKIDIISNTSLNLTAATNITMTASGFISLNGTQIRLNGSSRPLVRTNDQVSNPGCQFGCTGTIITGSPTVFTN